MDSRMIIAMGSILGVLLIASGITRYLGARARQVEQVKFVAHIASRIRAWWIMCVVFSFAILIGPTTTIILFALMSLLALREFITLLPTRRADHRALLYIFFLIVPIQYLLIGMGWYGMFVIFIPVYGFWIIALRAVLSGDCKDFLHRTASIQWALMVSVYCISHVPAIVKLNLPGFDGSGAMLLLFFVVVTELCDVMQFVFGKAFGRRKIVPTVSPNKTVEGFAGGVLAAGLIGMVLSFLTPFSIWAAGLIGLTIGVLGFAGDVTLSAVKRDLAVKDYGTLLPGHGGVLDRIDSMCIAAPVFLHLVRFFYTPGTTGF